jgi:stage II sporulation SpoE-like protein
MRRSPQHRLIGLAIALSLATAVVLALVAAAAAGASPIGQAVPSVTVKVGPIVTVETTPAPSVEVPNVAKVEVPTTPQAQVPLPPVTTPSLPARVTVPLLPTASTPVVKAPGTPVSPAGTGTVTGAGPTTAASGAAATATGTKAATTAATTAGNSAHAAATDANGGHVTPSARARHSVAHAAGDRGGAQGAAASSSPVTAGVTPAARAVGAKRAPARVAERDASHKASSGNTLDTIGRAIPFPVPVPDWSKPIILLLLLVAIWFAVRSRLAAVRARRLERQRTALLGDLDAMQAALVPAIPGRLDDLSVSVAYRPADGPAAGGDFYDLFVLEPGKVAIVLGDVAGHGRGALTQAALTRYTLRAYMQAGLEPRVALSLAGSVLSEPGELRFATVVVAIYDSVAGRLTYASAGHPPPVSIGFATPEPPTVCCSAPVGCNLPTGRRQTTLSVPVGGRVCFFSDGLLEARTEDGLLGRERLSRIVEGLAPSDGAPALLELVRDDAAATPDDMVACIVSSAVGTPAATGQIEELEVDGKSLAGANVPVFLHACGVGEAEIAALLVRAREPVAAGGTALLRIERSQAGEASVALLPGISAASSKAAIGRAAEARTLALR